MSVIQESPVAPSDDDLFSETQTIEFQIASMDGDVKTISIESNSRSEIRSKINDFMASNPNYN